jgi:hypothetical protein
MRRPDFSISRLICTLAPPPITRQFSAPPVLVARERTKIKGSYLLLSSSSPDNGPRKAWLGPAHQLARYALAESPATKTKVSLDTGHAMRRFARPTRFTNVTELGTRGKPYFSLKPHLSDTLKACLLSPKGVRGLFEADVVADREVITKCILYFISEYCCLPHRRLMFPHEASFNASFAHGVLFLEDARSKYVPPARLCFRDIHRHNLQTQARPQRSPQVCFCDTCRPTSRLTRYQEDRLLASMYENVHESTTEAKGPCSTHIPRRRRASAGRSESPPFRQYRLHQMYVVLPTPPP